MRENKKDKDIVFAEGWVWAEHMKLLNRCVYCGREHPDLNPCAICHQPHCSIHVCGEGEDSDYHGDELVDEEGWYR